MSAPVHTPEKRAQSHLCRLVVVTIVAALAVASSALGQPISANFRMIAETGDTYLEQNEFGRYPASQPVAAAPQDLATRSNVDVAGETPADEPVGPAGEATETESNAEVAGEAPADEPVGPAGEATETESNAEVAGEAPADEPVGPAGEATETESNAEVAGEAPADEPVGPAGEATETESNAEVAGEAPADEPVGPAGEATETVPDPDVAGERLVDERAVSDMDAAESDTQTRSPGKVRRVGESATPALEAATGDSETGILRRPRTREPIRPIEEAEVDPEKVALGRALFHDPRLSKDNTIACVSCHDLANGGDDGLRVSVGIEGKGGLINSPTVFNVGLNFKQFWDGRAETLEEQIDGPVQSPLELGSLWPEVIAKLNEHESYPNRFKSLYPDGINRNNAKNALAEFMKSLTTTGGRFDQWLRGEDDALSALEERGYTLFKFYGCVSCHQGANVGGNMFQVFGVLNNYFERRGNITDADLGRYNVTGDPVDRHAFKVPSLRMAVLTAPYLHDGSAATLRDAVDAMFEFQLGRSAPDEDKDAIVAFIKTLPGENKELFP